MNQQNVDDSQGHSPMKSGQNINQSLSSRSPLSTNKLQQSHVNEADEQGERKKKIIKYSIVSVGIIISLVLIVVLSTGMNHDMPKPIPPNPTKPRPPVEKFNPYLSSDLKNNLNSISGTMQGNPAINLIQTNEQNSKLTIPQGPNNQFIQNLSFNIHLVDYQIAYLNIDDAQNDKRWKIPDDIVMSKEKINAMKIEMLGLKFNPSPFSFSFNNIGNLTDWYVRTTDGSLVFMDKYIQMDFQVRTRRVFGLGQRVREFGLEEGAWTMWARDGFNYDNGEEGGQGSYGVHPFVLTQTAKPGEFIGMFFRNSNHQTVVLKYNEDGSSTLSYITTGGVIEVYFFIRGTVSKIIQLYQQMIGTPNLPPFWSLGFAQSSYAYDNEIMLRDMVEAYNKSNIPLEAVFVDIPYMDKFQSFTVDQQKFPKLRQFAEQLHADGQSIVLILDPWLSAVDKSVSNKYYTKAQGTKALIQSSINTGLMQGALTSKAEAEEIVFLDWFKNEAWDLWLEGLKDLLSKVQYDGIWLDVNENAAACDGECPKPQSQKYNINSITDLQQKRNLQHAQDQLAENRTWYQVFNDQTNGKHTYYLPFIAGSKNPDSMTLSLNGTHENNLTQYDTHSLSGIMSSQATYLSLLSDDLMPDKRIFLLSRSTFAGSGAWTSHWSGDNWRTWDYLKYSISGVMNMNLFGVPHTGSDVCGFYGKRDDQLCARWTQLSVFYPFARNHYNKTLDGQTVEASELYKLSQPWLSYAREAIYQRFEYMRLMYTCLFEATMTGASCFSPLFYQYPLDDNTFQNYEHTFLIGLGGPIKVTPVLKPNATKIVSYFPKGKWVSMNHFADIIVSKDGGEYLLDAMSPRIQVHLREGFIIPWQDNSLLKIKRTRDLINGLNPISLIVNRDQYRNAKGNVLLDGGISIQELVAGTYENYEIQMNGKYLTFMLSSGERGTQVNGHKIDKIIITDAIDLQITQWACYLNENRVITPLKTQFNQTERTFNLLFPESTPFFHIRDIYFGELGELNMCQKLQYKIKGDKPINLNANKASFALQSTSDSSVPNLTITFSLLACNVVKTYVNFESPQTRQRIPFEIEGMMTGMAQILHPSDHLVNHLVVTNNPFSFQLLGTVDGYKETIYSLDSLIFHEYIVQLGAKLQTMSGNAFQGVYGLGEKVSDKIFYEDGIYTLWSKDPSDTSNPADQYETGKAPGNNIYGTHPVYFARHRPSSFFGVFNLNANQQDWIIKNNKSAGEISITSIATGGIIELYFIKEATPELVIKKFHQLTGLAAQPLPKWALGWHQSRWGYDTLNDLEEVVKKYDENNIPLDVMWSDIDYMQDYKDFTIDQVRYKELPAFVDKLHNNSQFYIPIIDAGVAWRPGQGYASYDEGVAQDAYIKSKKGGDFIGRVWPNEAVFVDFNSENGADYWRRQLDRFYSTLKFDGLWFDMNEVTNFCDGPCSYDQEVADPLKYKFLYVPGNKNLEAKSIALDAMHAHNISEADMHSLFGNMQVKASSFWFYQKKLRPMMVSRSTFPGSASMGGYHWTGDNYAHESYMGYSVIGLMMMNIFGISFTGADICGFAGDTSPELCARWTVLGSLYPFARNHNAYGFIPQEPYEFKGMEYDMNITYMDIMKTAIRARYHLVPYMYTQMYWQTFGGTFYKPLFLEFYDDEQAIIDPQNNLMLGSALKVSVLSNELNQNETEFYFPGGQWCNVFNLYEDCFGNATHGLMYERSTRAYEAYVHLRQGYIIPIIDATSLGISRVMDLNKHFMDLQMSHDLDAPGHGWSRGTLYNDDGVTTDKRYNLYEFVSEMTVQRTTVKINLKITSTSMPASDSQECIEINKNDYLGNVVIHNALYYGLNWFYTGKVLLKNGTTVNVDVQYSQPLFKVFINEINLCMRTIKEIEINNVRVGEGPIESGEI